MKKDYSKLYGPRPRKLSDQETGALREKLNKCQEPEFLYLQDEIYLTVSPFLVRMVSKKISRHIEDQSWSLEDGTQATDSDLQAEVFFLTVKTFELGVEYWKPKEKYPIFSHFKTYAGYAIKKEKAKRAERSYRRDGEGDFDEDSQQDNADTGSVLARTISNIKEQGLKQSSVTWAYLFDQIQIMTSKGGVSVEARKRQAKVKAGFTKAVHEEVEKPRTEDEYWEADFDDYSKKNEKK